ncbi:MAG: hypothetical protein NVSMB9_03630 [Isosphaeraceae bacterium]
MITHTNVVSLLASTHRLFHFKPTDVWTLFHSFAFDFSVWEIWGAFALGGRLVIVPYWISRSAGLFLELLEREEVTVLNQTPSAFRQLVRAEEELGGVNALSLRLVIFGGESLELESLRPWFARHGEQGPRLINMYGITETTVHVTYREILQDDLTTSYGTSPIGVPISGWRVQVLDSNLQPVPIGVVGEIYVGGPGVAQGYQAQPSLTAQRFIADPFSTTPGERLYKSGDLARRNPDGSLVYAGRADHQVKIRGFRIELGEIEAAILKHAQIYEAVVVSRNHGVDDQRLVAYVVAKEEKRPTVKDLRRWLEPLLPNYMIPSTFISVNSIPLTVNGKLDAESLPDPQWGTSIGGPLAAEPLSQLEEAVATIWADVLGVKNVGLHDDFFELGGHSLLATQVVSRVRNTLGIDLSLRALFEAPSVAGLCHQIEDSRTKEKRHSLSLIETASRDVDLPLSFAQEALWFLEQLSPDQPTFNVSASARVEGELDVTALDRAFAEIVRRHEGLRTTFRLSGGRPVQVIASSLEVSLKKVDLRSFSEANRLRECQEMAREETRQVFDLARGPLVRGLILHLGDRDHVVLLTMHHIVTDGWSFGVAASELAALYEAFRHGRPSPLPDPPIQYADYSVWQRDRLQGDRLNSLLEYWTGRLRGVPLLELPTTRKRPVMRSARGATHFFRIPASLAETVRFLGRSEGATPFMVLLAAFQTLLSRYTGQRDFAVGFPVANRTQAEVEGLIGYFINMLAIRADLSGAPTFLELLARVREEAIGAFEHQELPFELLVEALHPRRDTGRTPVFQVMFVFQNNEMPQVGRDDLGISAFNTHDGTGTAKFDLTLAMADEGPEMVGSFEYDVDLFDSSMISGIAAHFSTLLESLVSAPEVRVSDARILSVGESDQVLLGWNRTRVERPGHSRVHQFFTANALQSPDALAVEGENTRLTYRELDEQSDRLARQLQALGVGAETRVGICVERSVEMAISLLAILKAGGAYVPLDPSYPPDRLMFMLEDSHIPILVTQSHLREKYSASNLRVVEVDHVTEDSVDDSRHAPLLTLSDSPDDPAYLIYTSGTTGTPRGAVLTHGGLANHALASADLFELGPDDRVLQFASLSFDIAVEEIFPAWSRGATVVLRGPDETLEPTRFLHWIEERRITVLDLPTAYWHILVNGLAATKQTLPPSLRLVVVGGERALPSVYRKWLLIGGNSIRWVNTYGPTETTVIATTFEPLTPSIPAYTEVADELPIGRPIANTRIYVLDTQLQPVPPCVPGELFIGGAGVGRGYLGQPALTAERFVPDPFSVDPGARLFRTGDLARWRGDGQIEFLGRLDDQIKIRGYRVEPGEVEVALLAHPEVTEAAVVAAQDANGDARLDAFVVTERENTALPGELRQYLREKLPRPLVPSSFTILKSLPLTPSGKIDRRSLATATTKSDPLSDVPLTPRDETESRLVRIWENVLDVRPVGIGDNFFDIGGHSLLAILLLARIEEEFGRRLELSALFLGPTIEEQAIRLRSPLSIPRPQSWSPIVTIQTQGSLPGFFCVHPAGGIVYCFQELALKLGTDQPFHAFQSAGLEEGQTPLESIDEMANCYVKVLQQVQPSGPYHVGGWSLGGVVAFEMARKLLEQGKEVATLALFDSRAPSPIEKVIPSSLESMAREFAALGLLSAQDTASDPRVDALVLAEFSGELTMEFGGNVAHLIRRLRDLSMEEKRFYLLKALKLDQVYNLETGPEQVGRLWTVLRANLLAAVRFQPRSYPGSALLFRARDASHQTALGPSLGWSRFLQEGITTYDIPGDHAGILKAPGVEMIAQTLRTQIKKTSRKSP